MSDATVEMKAADALAEAEHDVTTEAAKAPAIVQPEIATAETAARAEAKDVESGFDDVLRTADKELPAEEAAAAKEVPAVEALAKDVETGNFEGVFSAVPEFKKEVKAGYKTTEFWGAAAIVVLAQTHAFTFPGHYGTTIATFGSVASYILSRGLAKR